MYLLVDVKRSRQCISGNPDNFTVSISFEYELERLMAVSYDMICENRHNIFQKYAIHGGYWNTLRKPLILVINEYIYHIMYPHKKLGK